METIKNEILEKTIAYYMDLESKETNPVLKVHYKKQIETIKMRLK